MRLSEFGAHAPPRMAWRRLLTNFTSGGAKGLREGVCAPKAIAPSSHLLVSAPCLSPTPSRVAPHHFRTQPRIHVHHNARPIPEFQSLHRDHPPYESPRFARCPKTTHPTPS